MGQRQWRVLWVIAVLCTASGCQQGAWFQADGYQALAGLAHKPEWRIFRYPDSKLPSVAAVRRGASLEPVWVYIEGDGKAFLNRAALSDDPTPEDPVALQLASIPQDATVVYLGRPCQYVMAGGAACASKWWSTARYGEDVIIELNGVLDRLLAPLPANGVILVGYSGGGAVAALLAAQRSDVKGLITIAANLDTEAWTTFHRVTPLTESVNPASRAPDIGRVRQVHFAGEKDSTVPISITRSFMARLPAGSRAHLIAEPAFDHHCCWVVEWPRLQYTAMQMLRP